MSVAIIRFPGSNREQDMADAVTHMASKPPIMVWHAETELPAVDAVILPGGFSYGDYLRCGAIAARAPIMNAVREAAGKGVPILGVCNGFQILIEAGLLPGALMRNAGISFVCRSVPLKVTTTRSAFTQGYRAGETFDCPVAHGDGNFVCSVDTLKRLEDDDRIAFRYADGANPNGSTADIAGILSEGRNVLGMMPHPENAVLPHQAGQGGRKLFEGMLDAALAA